MQPRRHAVLLASLMMGWAACGDDEAGSAQDAAASDDASVIDSATSAPPETLADTSPSEVEVLVVTDRDCDGIADDDEATLGTDPDDDDSDDDGLGDGLELGRSEPVVGSTCAGFVPDGDASTTTDPLARDSDADGIDDGVEDADRDGRAEPGETASHTGDGDCDGLSDAAELATSYAGRRTDPNDADSDDDGLSDGLERGSTVNIADSGCVGVARDQDPGTTTDATTADSDGDGLLDGCEDKNKNGGVNFGESDPQAFDSDSDGLGDRVEDVDGDCSLDADETSAARADSDGDGIDDRVELALGVTDPRDADSDDDGLPDGAEDRDLDGVVDVDETDPNDADRDDDGLLDGEEDLDRDGVVGLGETDPHVSDSDRDHDGLLDRDEDHDGDGVVDAGETDPNDADSDDDEVPDGAEGVAGTDPLANNDPPLDVGAGIAAVCSPGEPLAVVLRQDHGGDWTLALPTAYDYRATITGSDHHAATFGDPDDSLAGFVLDAAPIGSSTDAAAQAQALVSRLTSGASALGTAGTPSSFAGRVGTSHDGFASVVDAQVALTLASETDASTLRNRVLAVLAGAPLESFIGVPGPRGASATSFIVRFTAVVRGARVIVLGGVMGADVYSDPDSQTLLDDLAAGTGLARALVDTTQACAPLTVSSTAKVDFIWMADISQSTDNDRGRIVSAAGSIFDALTLSGIDFRMGVVPSTENRVIDPGSPGQLRSGFTRSQTQFETDLKNTSLGPGISEGCEFGLTAMDDAIARALPRTVEEATTKLREDALFVAFYISDETAQEVESASGCRAPSASTGQSDGNRSLPPTTTQRNNINTIVQPFITRIVGLSGAAFGQILPVKSPFCSEGESGTGYVEVINALQGSFFRTCDSNPGQVLEDIIDTIAATAFDLVLTGVPIADTIAVAITQDGTRETTVVPRSRVDGFVYDAGTNAIFFRGSLYRPGFGDKVTVSYRNFTAPRAGVTCTAPLEPDASGQRCKCPSEPASGQCGGDTCGETEVCETDGDVCACRCAPDCGGVARGTFSCAPEPVCGAVCADADGDGERDCNMRCGVGTTCTAECTCACVDLEVGGAHDCNGLITPTSRALCDVASCAAVCPLDCAGCGADERCDLATCECVARQD